MRPSINLFTFIIYCTKSSATVVFIATIVFNDILLNKSTREPPCYEKIISVMQPSSNADGIIPLYPAAGRISLPPENRKSK
jgi:hypothetical protein